MIEITEAHLRRLLLEAWECGWTESGEGYNGEYCPGKDIERKRKARTDDIVAIMKDMWTLSPEDY